MTKRDGRSPSGSGSRPAGGAATASPAKPSIPNADDSRLKRRRFGSGDSDGRPRSISKAHRDLFDTFTAPIHDRIRNLPDDELWMLLAACQSVSQINCGWDAYAFARTHLDTAAWEMKRRIASAGEAGTATDAEGGVAEDEHAVRDSADAPRTQP